jgi:hypothetical protein
LALVPGRAHRCDQSKQDGGLQDFTFHFTTSIITGKKWGLPELETGKCASAAQSATAVAIPSRLRTFCRGRAPRAVIYDKMRLES